MEQSHAVGALYAGVDEAACFYLCSGAGHHLPGLETVNVWNCGSMLLAVVGQFFLNSLLYYVTSPLFTLDNFHAQLTSISFSHQ
jgi:hypothetical protein